jgi:elongation factor G
VYVRVYSGTIEPGQRLLNPRSGKPERVARALRMLAEERHAMESVAAGDIAVLTGLKHTATGDTLCAEEAPIALEGVHPPEAVITKVFEPESGGERERLRAALGRLLFEDPTLRAREDEDTGQWLVSGMGELHLEIAQHRLQDDFHLQVRVGQPRVAYREAPSAAGRGRATVERSMAGHEAFGDVELAVEPLDEGRDSRVACVACVEWAPSCSLPASVRPAVTEALELASLTGPCFGFPLVGARIVVLGGRSRPERDFPPAFAQAASQALRQALVAAQVKVLEPVMGLEIEAPADFSGGILADLGARNAQIAEVVSEGELRRVTGRVALASVFGYSTALRSLSQGRASFSLEPRGFQPVPDSELEVRGLVWR